MSYAAIICLEVENVEESIVKEVMDKIGWDGIIMDNIKNKKGNTVYFEGHGNICIGTSEIRQEQLIRETFNKKIEKEVEISIFWDYN